MRSDRIVHPLYSEIVRNPRKYLPSHLRLPALFESPGYIFPQITNGSPTNAYIHQATYYSYDNKQRIIKDSTVFAGSIQPVVNTYSYDINGNKTGSNYDDKINLNRTNKIWMFLNRDYSVNNPYNAASYNTTGLPANLNLSQGENPLKFLGNIFYKAEILYECNPKAK